MGKTPRHALALAELDGSLRERIEAGERLAVIEALNLVEDTRPQVRARVRRLCATLRPKARKVGLTGPPGVGKSTLAGVLAQSFRRAGERVALLAIDPSSERSGGSILGDRARIDDGDDGLLIRSMATAGQLGGLASAAPAAIDVLASAFDVVLVETTGVGQTETDVRDVCDHIVLVVQPGSGDTLQFLKAGIMEIPDLLVVNKADLESLARRAENDLHVSDVPVLRTSATQGDGVDALRDSIASMVIDETQRHRGRVARTMREFRREYGERALRVLGLARVRAHIEDALTRVETTDLGDDLVGELGRIYLEEERSGES